MTWDLKSADRKRILDALGRLGASSESPDESVVAAVLELCANEDEEIVHDAVFAAGIHWRRREVYEAIVGLLTREWGSDEVPKVCVAALLAMSESHGDLRYSIVRTLTDVVRSDGQTDGVRWLAYLSALRAKGQISAHDWVVRSSERDLDHSGWQSLADSLESG